MAAAQQAKPDRTNELVTRLLEISPDAMVVTGAPVTSCWNKNPICCCPDVSGCNVKQRAGDVVHPGIRLLGHGLELLVHRRDGTEFTGSK